MRIKIFYLLRICRGNGRSIEGGEGIACLYSYICLAGKKGEEKEEKEEGEEEEKKNRERFLKASILSITNRSF